MQLLMTTVVPSLILVGLSRQQLIYWPNGTTRLSDNKFSRTFARFGKTTTGNWHQNPFYCAGLVHRIQIYYFVIFIISMLTIFSKTATGCNNCNVRSCLVPSESNPIQNFSLRSHGGENPDNSFYSLYHSNVDWRNCLVFWNRYENC